MSRFTYSETDAIREARKLFPDDGQRTLARRLDGQEWFPAEHRHLRTVLNKRGYASIYGAIRRFDAQHSRASDRATSPGIREQHHAALNRLNLKSGDKVRVERKFPDETDGWDNIWVEEMDGAVGLTGEVKDVQGEIGVDLYFSPSNPANYLSFPAQVLTVVERAGHRQPQTA